MGDLPETTGGNQVDPRQATQFKPGQSGNPAGRPKGIRHKLGEAFLQALQKDFAQHGENVIAAVRDEKPDQYLKVVASILPKELELSDDTMQAMVQVLFRGPEKGA